MKWFGSNWGAPVCDELHHEATPTFPCAGCGGAFKANDCGVILPFSGDPEDPPEIAYHHRCLMANLGLGYACGALMMEAKRRELTGEVPSLPCPRCGAKSANPTDVAEGYCGACHDWTRP